MKTDNIFVYNASAGSGKTHQLAHKFCHYLIDEYNSGNKDAYRYVMAVTFTNKATYEMKSRIVLRLYELSKKESYKDSAAARDILQRLVHDYTMFKVSTIDSFFQKVLKAFAVEMGSVSAYETSVDDKYAIEAAMDRVYARLSKDSKLLNIIKRISQARMEDGKNWDWRESLLDICKNVVTPEYQKNKLSIKLNSPNPAPHPLELKELDYKKRLDVLENVFVSEVINVYDQICQKASGIEWGAIKSINRTTFSKFNKFLSKNPTDSFVDIDGKTINCRSSEADRWLSDPSYYFKKDSESDVEYIDSLLGDSIKRLCGLFDQYYEEYCTLNILRSQIWETIVMDYLSEELDEYLASQQLALLSNSPQVLSELIEGSQAPFVYEKIGARIDHYLLDEFQDTSIDQYMNFKPLLSEGVSREQQSFIVGDVKQSIYRWRRGNWRLLNKTLKADFSETFSSEPLNTNYRSLENIVWFNNQMFSNNPGFLIEECKKKLEDVLNDSNSRLPSVLEEIYKDSCQQVKKEYKTLSNKGVVHIISCSKLKKGIVSQEDFILLDMANRIKDLKERGFKDIAVLTSSRNEANKAANYLVGQGIDIISGDSIKLDSNRVVLLLVEILKKIADPKDKGLEAMLRLTGMHLKNANCLDFLSKEGEDFLTSVKGCNNLYEVCKLMLRNFFENVPESDYAFVKSFLDQVLDYSSAYGSSIVDFLKWWDSKKEELFIPEPNLTGAVKIMTMHKAKGLAFNVVFIPFLRDDIARINSSYGRYGSKWFKSSSPIVGYGGSFLLPLKPAMAYTVFKEDYKNELMEVTVDNLNLAYVSFTRAKERLYIYAKEGSDSKKKVLSKISSALDKFCSENSSGPQKMFSANEGTLGDEATSFTDYILGNESEEPYFSEDETAGKVIFTFRDVSFLTNDPPKTKLRAQFEDDDILRGVLYHELFSYIDSFGNTSGSVEERVKTAVSRFLKKHPKSLIGDNLRELSSSILDKIYKVKKFNWFDNSNRIRTEDSIISEEGTFRPDRVIISKEGNKWATVVDYKFGKYDSSKSSYYIRQVSDYMELLREMKFEKVEGYLWYVTEDKVLNVSTGKHEIL